MVAGCMSDSFTTSTSCIKHLKQNSNTMAFVTRNKTTEQHANHLDKNSSEESNSSKAMETMEAIQVSSLRTPEQTPPQMMSNQRMNNQATGSLRPHSTPATLNWLADNYVQADNVCIPRHVIYRHYCEFCEENSMTPVNPASFGKIIRQQFRKVKNRRLGTRGASTYHYHGIGISARSSHYGENYSTPSTSSWSKKDSSSQKENIQVVENTATPPQSEPSTSHINIAPSNFPQNPPTYQDFPKSYHSWNDDIKKFFMMYQSHCYRIYQTIFTSHVEEIKDILAQFWNNIPINLNIHFNSNIIINLVSLCDATLYRTLSTLLLPSTDKPISSNIIEPIRKFSDTIILWLNDKDMPIPASIQDAKKNLAIRLTRIVKRLISLNRVWPTVKVMSDDETMIASMSREWQQVDKTKIFSDLLPLFLTAFNNQVFARASLNALISSWDKIVERQITFKVLIDWFDFILSAYILSSYRNYMDSYEEWSSTFLLAWSRICQMILYDLTLSSALSFGPFHLLSIISNDYLSHCVEMVDLDSLIKIWRENLESQGTDARLQGDWTSPGKSPSPSNIEPNECFEQPGPSEQLDQTTDLTLMQILNEFSPQLAVSFFDPQNMNDDLKNLLDQPPSQSVSEDDEVELVLNEDEEKIIIETLMEVDCDSVESYLDNTRLDPTGVFTSDESLLECNSDLIGSTYEMNHLTK